MSKLAKWQRWLPKIYDEVTLLVWSKDNHARIIEIVEANSEINHGHGFYNWIFRNYVDTALMGIRRQLDGDGRSISMQNLLLDMSENHQLLNREMHRSLYSADTLPLADPTFDKIAGPGRSDVPKQHIEDDIAKLTRIRATHKKFIDKRIAHFDRAESLGPISTFSDLGHAIEGLEELVADYTLLLEAKYVSTLSPVPHYDWNSIFEKPWIERTPREG